MTAQRKLRDAPGCIGSIVVRKRIHPLCKTCEWRTWCAKIQAHNEQLLAKELAVDVKAVAPSYSGALSPKGADALAGFQRRGIEVEDIRRAMKMPEREAYKVTAEWRPQFLKHGFLLLGKHKTLTRTRLGESFRETFGWKQASASSHVTCFIDVATHLGIAVLRNDQIEVRE